jgi:3-oxoadipate enol-lactonase
MPRARVGDINIYYEATGRGEPLLLIMGLGGGSSLWWRQVESLSPDYRVIAYDSRGVGRSDGPDAPYSMEMMTADAAGLLETLGVARAHVYGVSMGGMVAQELALRHPGLVTSLVLGATTCGGAQATLPPPESLEELFNIMSLAPAEIARVSAAVTFSAGFISRHPATVRQWLRKGAESPPSAAGYRGQAQAVAGFQTYDRLPQISAPTLILAGTGDQLIPVENSRILASRIPRAELVLFEGAGHGYLWEAENEANLVVRDFLQRHPLEAARGRQGG